MTNTDLHKPDFDEEAFVPSAYNRTYYAEVMEDERCLIRWQASELDGTIRGHLAKLGIRRFSSHFDVGSGPTVHHLLALEKYSDAIDLADYLPENLEEIRRWVSGRGLGVHDWTPFVRAILAAENVPVTDAQIIARETSVRGKIRSFNTLDLKAPTRGMARYTAPFVTSFFVADSATGEKHTFAAMTKTAFRLVASNGLFVAAYLGGCEEYNVGGRWLRSANLNQADIECALAKSGAKDIRLQRFDTPTLASEGFDHIFAVTAIA